MRMSSNQIVLLLSTCLVLSGGCALPGSGPVAPSSGRVPHGRGPAPPSMIAPQTAAHASISDLQPQHQVASPSLATVGYTAMTPGVATHLSDHSACGCQPTSPGYSSSGCSPLGCRFPGGCNACRPQAPYGYAMPMGPWNAFGIDPQEFICDGGDHPPRASLRRDDTIAGLQPEDTVVHYTNQAGDIEFRASNRVCLYAPRFLAVRQITGALAGGHAVGAAQVDRPVGAGRVDQPLPGLVMTDSIELRRADVARRIDLMRERNRGVPLEGILAPEMASDVLALLVGLTIDELLALQDEQRALLDKYLLCAVTWELTESLEVVVEDLKPPTLVRDQHLDGLTLYEFPDGRLQICKLADRADALPGEIVNFAIRVENVGDAPVDQIVLTDNLTTRLEYVEGSQTCSGGAIFESFANEGQSLRLQWKLTDQLRVGEGVTIRFQCRVR